MSRRTLVLPVAAAAALLSVVPATAKGDRGLKGEVGPGYEIKIRNNGAYLTTIKAGTYALKVEDNSAIHNFHLRGPGLDRQTSPAYTGERVWTVRLKPGTYRYWCDPHHTAMRGLFRVTR